MGAFLITYPRDRIRTVVVFGFFVRITLIPAIVLVGLWFLTQLISEVGAVAQVQTGGFAFGALTSRLFESRSRRAQQGLRS